VSVSNLQVQLAKLLGLDSTRLKAFTLRVEAGQVPTIEASYLVIRPGDVKLEELTQKFDLVPRNEC
jgi:hypothetical protein